MRSSHGTTPPHAFLDTAEGLRFLGGRLPSYQRLLQKFADTHVEDAVIIDYLLQTGDFTTAKRMTHTLKGVAASLGARPLRDAACQVEQQIQEHLDPALMYPAVDHLKETLGATLDEIRQLNLASSQPALIDLSPEELRGYIAQLDELLLRQERRSVPLWVKIKPLLEEAIGAGQIAELNGHILREDLAAGHEALKKMMQDWPGLKPDIGDTPQGHD